MMEKRERVCACVDCEERQVVMMEREEVCSVEDKRAYGHVPKKALTCYGISALSSTKYKRLPF